MKKNRFQELIEKEGDVPTDDEKPTIKQTPIDRYWLVCATCKTKEIIMPHTEFVHCPVCGSSRHAETNDGRPAVAWSDAE